MGLRISTNVESINAHRNMSTSQGKMSNAMAQLSSGSQINKAADDAAGLAISERLKGQIRSLRKANQNANDGISMVQVAEGGLNEIGNIIVRLRELGIQAASDTVGNTERGFLDKEVQQLKSELERIAKVTTWGETKLLDGSSPSFDYQVGIFNDDFEDRITFDSANNVATLEALELADVDYTTKEGAQGALRMLDSAQTTVNGYRANLGALQNRLMSTVNNLSIAEENLSAANSRIRDPDVARAAADLTRENILLNASISTLSQANQAKSVALKLIG
ncbi:MAG: flagellin FliC [Bdellovibrionales bacterium]|nr:flagellin FliC [Bdellovibrionales bacterium]